MGGRFCILHQLYKKFSGNEVFALPKLNQDQKQEKGLRRKLKSFFPEIRWDQKKKRSSPQFATIFGRNFVGSFSPEWMAIFPLVIQRLTLDGRTPKSRWGDAKSQRGTQTFNGGMCNPANASPLQFKYWMYYRPTCKSTFEQNRAWH